MTSSQTAKEITLERRIGERRKHHRALLLYAMQAANKRSVRAVARAVGISEGSARNWRKKDEWDIRIAAQTVEADALALQIYRREYLVDYGKLELKHVAKNVVQPIVSADIADENVKAQHDATVAANNAMGSSMQAVEQATVQAIADHRRDIREDADKHVRLVDASLGVIARKLKADEVRVSVRDIPVLLECRDRLVNVINGTHSAGSKAAIESVRVKQARKNGTDIIEAMQLDAEELVVILQALSRASNDSQQSCAESVFDAEKQASSQQTA